MADELTLADLRALMQRRGVALTDEELSRLLPGVLRARQQAAELRTLLAVEDEPAARFDPARRA
jgi:hypothetical protein